MAFVLICNDKPDSLELRLKTRPAHVAYIEGFLDKLILAGPLLDSDGETLINILPVDNCAGVFAEVVIYNRWGRKVFTSGDREFKWYPGQESAGVYYYKLRYSHGREYTGWIHVIGEGSE